MKKIIFIIWLLGSILFISILVIIYNLKGYNNYIIINKDNKIISKTIKELEKIKKIDNKDNLYIFLSKDLPNLKLKNKDITLKKELSEIKIPYFILRPLILNYYWVTNNDSNERDVYYYYNKNILKLNDKDINELWKGVHNPIKLHNNLVKHYNKILVTKDSNEYKLYKLFLENLKEKKKYQNLTYDSSKFDFLVYKTHTRLWTNYFNNLLYNKEIDQIIKSVNIIIDANNEIITSKYATHIDLLYYIYTNNFLLDFIKATYNIDWITNSQKKELLKTINKIISTNERMNILKNIKIKERIKDKDLKAFDLENYITEDNYLPTKILWRTIFNNIFNRYIDHKKLNDIYISFINSYFKTKLYKFPKENNLKYLEKISWDNIILKNMFDPLLYKDYYDKSKLSEKNILLLKNKLTNDLK